MWSSGLRGGHILVGSWEGCTRKMLERQAHWNAKKVTKKLLKIQKVAT